MRYEVTETAVLVCPWLGAELQLFMYYQSTEDGGGHEAERGLHLAEDEQAHLHRRALGLRLARARSAPC